MIDLTDVEEIKKLDPKNVYGSTELFISQCEQIWNEAKDVEFSDDLKDVANIVVCGMGGSAYGGYVIQSLFKDHIRVPLLSNNDYDLPAFVNENSLVLLSSYSGSTEESLACGEVARKKGFKIAGITAGGKLGAFLKEHGSASLIFDPKNNPSGQPRLGTGYMVFGFIALLSRLGFISLNDDEVKAVITDLKANLDDTKSQAREIAQKLQNYFPVIFSAEFLNGNAHIMRNQFNETSKTFSAYEDIPELNHHLMEGFKYPENTPMKVLFLNSEFYSPIHKRRIGLTQDVVEKNKFESIVYEARGTTKLAQMLNVLSFGGYLTLYLALVYGQDPSLIPWVDYFKDQLHK